MGNLLLVIFFITLLPYSNHTLKIWDESSYALNAIEMSMDFDNLLINFRDEKPDFYSVKPTFVIFLQAICIRILGINEFAIRLPSIFFGILSVFMIKRMSYGLTKNKIISFISPVVFLTSNLLYIQHGMFSGNLDITLMFFTSTAFLIVLNHSINFRDLEKFIDIYLIVFVSLIFFGFLSKGLASIFFFPSILFLLISNWNKYQKFKTKILIAGLLIIMIPISYYTIANFIYPDYFKVVFLSEIARIYDPSDMKGHIQDTFYYFKELPNHLNYYLFFIPIFLFGLKNSPYKFLIIQLGLSILIYLVSLSLLKVKIIWYLIPLLPLYSIFIAVLFKDFISKIFTFDSQNALLIISVISILFIAKPIKNLYQKLDSQVLLVRDKYEIPGNFLNNLFEENKIKGDINIVFNHPYPLSSQLEFYRKKVEYYTEFKVNITNEIDFDNDLIMIARDEFENFILNKNIHLNMIKTWDNFVLVEKINDNKNGID